MRKRLLEMTSEQLWRIKPNKKERLPIVAPSVRKVPQLYSPKASYIASQLYLGYAQVIFASRVFGANIISLKLQVSISLCVITQNITVRPVSQYHLIFLFLR